MDGILTEFDTVWADRTPVAHANVDFEPDENSSWARVTVIHSSAAQVSLGSVGSRTFPRFGTVIVQVLVPKGTSTQPALELSLREPAQALGYRYARACERRALTWHCSARSSARCSRTRAYALAGGSCLEEAHPFNAQTMKSVIPGSCPSWWRRVVTWPRWWVCWLKR